MAIQHESEGAALMHVANQLEDLRGGPWMVCIFEPREDGKVICHRTSHQFPNGLEQQCQEALSGVFEKENQPEPLPVASLGVVRSE